MSNSAKEEITIERMKDDEVDSFIELFCTTFEQPEADMILPMRYPLGLDDPKVKGRLRDTFMTSTGKDDRYVARSRETKELIGVSSWALVDNPATTVDEVEAEVQATRKAKANLPPVPGMNVELDTAYDKAMAYSTFHVMQGTPYVELSILAVHPDYQRRGIGLMLLQDGLSRVEKYRLPIFLSSAVQGKPLYEKLGFTTVQDFPLDCREYGCQSQGKHWLMLRAV